ncbi:MAG TPA: hypothetical protein VGI40_00940 [Pirellulaceae bacterium]
MADDSSFSLKFSMLPGQYNTGDRDHTLPVSVTRVRAGYAWEHHWLDSPMFEAWVYQAKFVEDFDGAARAYGWDRPDSSFKYAEPNLQKNLQPLESRHGQQAGLANAASPYTNLWYGHDFRWVGVYSATEQFALSNGFEVDYRPPLRDNRGHYPAIQPLGAPAPGYYVSQCPGIVNKGLPDWDQRKYADAETFPYIVLPNQFMQMGARIGDVGLAVHPLTGRSKAFAFADTGTVGHLGESSSYLYKSVSGGQGNAGYVTFVIFPGSNWYRLNAEGLDQAGAIDFRVSGSLMLASVQNPDEFPLLMAYGGDLSRLRHAQQLIKQGKKPPKPANFDLMVNALKPFDYAPQQRLFD